MPLAQGQAGIAVLLFGSDMVLLRMDRSILALQFCHGFCGVVADFGVAVGALESGHASSRLVGLMEVGPKQP